MISSRTMAMRPTEADERSLDQALVRRCAYQDPRALEELVRRHQAKIYQYLFAMARSHEDAEEMTVEVFTRVWRYAARFRFEASVETWLYRIALNLMRDLHGRRKNRVVLTPIEGCKEANQMSVESAGETVGRKLAEEERQAYLLRAMARLSESDRSALYLYYVEDLAFDQVANRLGVSYTVLKTRLSRARKRLHRAYHDVKAA